MMKGMIFIKNKFIIFVILFAASGFIWADDWVKTTVDRHKIPVNESTVLTLTLSGNDFEKPELPKIEGFDAYAAGQSQNVTLINGKMSSSQTYTFILQPKTLGTFTIPAIQVTQEGQIHQTDPIQVEVVEASLLPTRKAQRSSSLLPEGENTSEENTENGKAVFVEADVDKKEACVGEQVTYAFKLYRRVNLMGQPAYAPPDFTGFWKEDLPPEKNYYERVENQKYLVSELDVALFPTTSGDLSIGPAKLTCQIPARSRHRDSFSVFNEDPFEFFNSDPFEMFSGRKVSLATNPIAIKVLPLPQENVPPHFSGAVGSFEIHAQVDKKEVKAQQPITFSITLEGKGNIETLAQPKFKWGQDFKIYDSGESTDSQKEGGVIHGKKVFKKVIIPIKDGNLKIPSVSFSFFDPEKKTYQTVKTSPILLKIKPAETEVASETIPVVKPQEKSTQKEPTLLQQDISFIKTDFQHFRNVANLPQPKTLAFTLIFPFSLLFLSALIHLRRRGMEKNQGLFMARRAYRKALSQLKSLQRSLKEGDSQGLSTQWEKILTDYLSSRLNIPVLGYSSSELEMELQKRNYENTLIQNLRALMEELHFGRFTPDSLSADQKIGVFKRIQDLLGRMEKVKS
ncbi:MAG: protein BatD [Chlamydiae bacterium]|nr:protein BatD [Chlamydiota bacterium]MBI3267176.1 protein BatD [Chlamydiota bacterium]